MGMEADYMPMRLLRSLVRSCEIRIVHVPELISDPFPFV